MIDGRWKHSTSFNKMGHIGYNEWQRTGCGALQNVAIHFHNFQNWISYMQRTMRFSRSLLHILLSTFQKVSFIHPRPLVLNRVDIPKIIVSQKKILFPNLFLAYPWYFLLQEAGLKEGFVFARSYHSADIVRGAKDFLEAESFINNHVKIKTLLYGTFSREWLNNLVV